MPTKSFGIANQIMKECDVNEITITENGSERSDTAQNEVSYDLQKNIGYLLRTTNQYAVSRFNSYMKDVMSIDNVTTTQFAVITTIFKFPKISIGELSRYTSIDQPTLNGLVKRLDDRGILILLVNANDKRSRQIYLTEKGNLLAEDLTRHGDAIGDFIMENLTARETRRLRELLHKLHACK